MSNNQFLTVAAVLNGATALTFSYSAFEDYIDRCGFVHVRDDEFRVSEYRNRYGSILRAAVHINHEAGAQ